MELKNVCEGTAIRATGTIKRASKRNIYLPLYSPLPLTLPSRSTHPLLANEILSLSLFFSPLSAFVLYVNGKWENGNCLIYQARRRSSRNFLALAKMHLNILIAFLNRPTLYNENNKIVQINYLQPALEMPSRNKF